MAKQRWRQGALALSLGVILGLMASCTQAVDAPYEIGRLSQKKTFTYAEAEVEYPEFKGGNPETAEVVNAAIRKLAEERIAEAKQMSDGMTPEDIAFRKEQIRKGYQEADAKSTVDLSYEIRERTPKVLSILCYTSAYFMGAAHPNPGAQTQTFDLRRGRMLVLGDLFKPGAPYLETIARMAHDQLVQSQKDYFEFEEGTAAKPDNYDLWLLEKKGLTIVFPPYQVGPYVEGFHEVTIPYAKLKEWLRPEVLELVES